MGCLFVVLTVYLSLTYNYLLSMDGKVKINLEVAEGWLGPHTLKWKESK